MCSERHLNQGSNFLARPLHRLWLVNRAHDLLSFFLPASINSAGGFYALDQKGAPIAAQEIFGELRSLHATTRMVHCAVIGHQLGLPGADYAIDHGLDFLWSNHRDARAGGYFWTVNDLGAVDGAKMAYGHAFVLLAAASAKVVGHPDADRLLTDISQILQDRFWDAKNGAATEEYNQDWSVFSNYRGQNSNMHLTESLMAAYEATGDATYLTKATSIAELIINRHARSQGWRVAEHFDPQWNIDRDYKGDPMFRPYGLTPGHALEWARLLVQLWELGHRTHDWMLTAAKSLFIIACETGWDVVCGGFFYTLDWNNQPVFSDRFWWPCCEGIAAAAVLQKVSADPIFETWYRRIWSFASRHLIDPATGGWFAELDDNLTPVEKVFQGKPDIYHALQACLIPLLPTDGSLTKHLANTDYHDLVGAHP